MIHLDSNVGLVGKRWKNITTGKMYEHSRCGCRFIIINISLLLSVFAVCHFFLSVFLSFVFSVFFAIKVKTEKLKIYKFFEEICVKSFRMQKGASTFFNVNFPFACVMFCLWFLCCFAVWMLILVLNKFFSTSLFSFFLLLLSFALSRFVSTRREGRQRCRCHRSPYEL